VNDEQFNMHVTLSSPIGMHHLTQ